MGKVGENVLGSFCRFFLGKETHIELNPVTGSQGKRIEELKKRYETPRTTDSRENCYCQNSAVVAAYGTIGKTTIFDGKKHRAEDVTRINPKYCQTCAFHSSRG